MLQSRYGGMLSRFDFSLKNKVQTIWFSGGGGAVFSNSLILDFFSDKVKAFIFVTIKSLFTVPIRPYTRV